MKLITLNIWGGHVQTPLLEFIKRHQEIDIFCLQEVYHNASEKISDEDRKVCLNVFSEIQSLLLDHEGFFRPVVEKVYGISMFIRKNIEILREGEIQIYDNPNYHGRGPTHSRNLQWVECRINRKIYFIVNIHGLWNGKGKKDSPERIAQSRRIKEFVDTIDTPKILCGDFNLRPDTESIKILEKEMRNLIKTYNIQSTRTNLYPKEEKFADYIFTSSGVTVNNFAVLKDEVSDHSPLLLDFE
ncbi:MAG: endonuclease/exonuclease/phosphatase family protein [Gammaproteobacteria bacterium]|nr:endonuclease/exonuclease/phosphatase family protein [Gammaproteobacteria bacterium]MCW5584168.1 endonuclease/exonuclease/phosphatase family protein [Gammaproteobacteria bacterium]